MLGGEKKQLFNPLKVVVKKMSTDWEALRQGSTRTIECASTDAKSFEQAIMKFEHHDLDTDSVEQSNEIICFVVSDCSHNRML